MRELVNPNLPPNGFLEDIPATSVAQTGAGWVNGTATGTNDRAVSHEWHGTGSGSWAVRFDDVEKHNGNNSIKISLTGVNSYTEVRNAANSYDTKWTEGFEVQPSTSYTLKFWIKLANVSGDSNHGWYAYVTEGAGNSTNIGSTIGINYYKTNMDWTEVTLTWTTKVDARRAHVELRCYGHTGLATLVGDAWFSEIEVKPTTPVTRELV